MEGLTSTKHRWRSFRIVQITIMADYETYKLGNFKLKSGEEIPDAFIAYKTLGDPSLPAIIYPTWYSGRALPNC